MKNFTKISSVILALFLTLCFVSCKSGGPSEVASFKGDDPGQGGTIIISFYDDATFTYEQELTGRSVDGTYTGDVSKDGVGTITFDTKSLFGDSELNWKIEGDTITIGKAYKDMIMAGFSLTRIKD